MKAQFDYKQVYCYIDGEEGGGYKFTPFNGISLQQFGEAGWELVSTVPLPDAKSDAGVRGAIMIFKRTI